MTKLCTVCGTENKDQAQFCRSCGTSFAAAPTPAPAAAATSAAADNICGECGFQNKPGIRYCANCGMSLGAAAAADAAQAASEAAPAGDPYAGLSPPPISYPSFAPVAPYPPPFVAPADEQPVFDQLQAADRGDPGSSTRPHEEYAAPTETGFLTDEVTPAGKRSSAPLFGGIALALIAAGAAAWWFLGNSPAPSPAPPVATPIPIAAPAPIASEPAPATAPIIVEAAPASAPPVAAVAATPSPALVASAPSASPPGLGAPPTAAAPLPQLSDPAPVESADAEAKRLAADKAKREKAARDKAERDAKAKTLIDQRDQAAAAKAKAEQDAQARRRVEESQPARRPPTAVPAAPVAPPTQAQARGVREICAGRGTIAEAVCQSRQCGQPEHANEAICRQLREADDRRRNYQN